MANLIIGQLQEDHKQLVRMLYHLEREVKAIAGLQPGSGSLETILDILDYVQMYPELWHHPVEDIIYEKLLKKAIPDPQLLHDALEEHELLETLTENLHVYIDAAALANDKPPMRFVKSTSDYVSRQLMHMEFEQKHLFPLTENYLDQNDWQDIKESMKLQRQLTDESRIQAYSELYRDIARGSMVTAH